LELQAMSSIRKAENPSLQNLETVVEHTLIPVQPLPAFRNRLRQALVAAASSSSTRISTAGRHRLGVWLLVLAGGAALTFVARQLARLLSRRD
jgi:hypothetical protein